MVKHRDVRQKNRRVGMILIAVFLGLGIMSVVIVLLRKYGFA